MRMLNRYNLSSYGEVFNTHESGRFIDFSQVNRKQWKQIKFIISAEAHLRREGATHLNPLTNTDTFPVFYSRQHAMH